MGRNVSEDTLRLVLHAFYPRVLKIAHLLNWMDKNAGGKRKWQSFASNVIQNRHTVSAYLYPNCTRRGQQYEPRKVIRKPVRWEDCGTAWEETFALGYFYSKNVQPDFVGANQT